MDPGTRGPCSLRNYALNSEMVDPCTVVFRTWENQVFLPSTRPARAAYALYAQQMWDEGHLTGFWSLLEEWASLEVRAGHPELAARLLGIADAFVASHGAVAPRLWGLWWVAEPEAIRARVRAGDQPLAAAWAEGQRLRLDDALELLRSAVAAASGTDD
jgi:hypothetical protein